MKKRTKAERISQSVIVLVTCPNARVADKLASKLVGGRLAACVNILAGVVSIFRWEGKIDRSRETLLIIKTTAARFPALEESVRRLHPYEVPEIIALPVKAGLARYLHWIRESVR